ncbi:hypothetical protein DSL72_001896 [Monilinia vaccinii-corymbosi]|uniref:Uncharacterized protein n=1 Tax=Monilinia vaccinii-corymbosi TaxID=61207 RepID=A0A8A3PB40_9HELO|nr:hypothetical protein DSL72_001896 [Monilinia vaccinii-corymbosi]
MHSQRNPKPKTFGPPPYRFSSLKDPAPQLIYLDMVWLTDNGWESFESFMKGHGWGMSNAVQLRKAISLVQSLRWSGTKLPHISKADVDARLRVRLDLGTGLYVPTRPRRRPIASGSGPSSKMQDIMAQPNWRVSDKHCIQRPLAATVEPSPIDQKKTHKKKKSVKFASQEDHIINPTPESEVWKGKSARRVSEGDDSIGPVSKASPIEEWTRAWSDEIDEIRRSMEAADIEKAVGEESDSQDGGVALDTTQDVNFCEDIINPSDSSVSVEDDSSVMGPSSSSEPMTSTESLESCSEKK